MKRILSLALAALLLTSPAFAAVTANSVVTAQTPNRGVVQFLNGTDSPGTYKTLYTAGANGSKVTAIWASNSDTVSHLGTCQIVNSSVKYGGAAVTLTIGAGFLTGVPALSMMAPAVWPGLPIDGNGNSYFYMASGDTLQCTFATAFTTSGAVINMVAAASDF